jgi:hypothetical protein
MTSFEDEVELVCWERIIIFYSRHYSGDICQSISLNVEVFFVFQFAF